VGEGYDEYCRKKGNEEFRDSIFDTAMAHFILREE
jgi:hypothetical protein